MSIEALSSVIAAGKAADLGHNVLAERTKEAIDGLFGTRYPARTRYSTRAAIMPGPEAVSFAGLVHEDSPTSGVYGGMSLIWFPIEATDENEAGSLLTLVCGTRGLAPDEQVLGRPGHARHLQALRRHAAAKYGTAVWVKHDPTNLADPFPKVLSSNFARFSRVIDRYGHYIYSAVQVPTDPALALGIVSAFVDFYAWERGWSPLKAAQADTSALKDRLRSHLFPSVSKDEVHALLRERRFVVLQGPPGTGKTRLAGELLSSEFNGKGSTVQFHPAVTYETFVAGIAPDVNQDELRFQVKPGWLVDAARQATDTDHLMVIDEINRADLGRVLGEAIYLFEPAEIARGAGRSVKLPQALDDGTDTLEIPQGLFVLGTMNSADRSIAILDLAVRRRFAFVDVWPDIRVVEAQGLALATEAFGRLQDVFAQYAPDDGLVLVPGHAYFLANSPQELARRLRFELTPLLVEYLHEGRLGACESELRAYLDWLEGEVTSSGTSA